ncbi:conserved exported hypothetical protein [Bradyrhizobium sp. ORS 375]|uniref:hypothetical protein n=1 Tax=Bradyrhizobium sp. (strain ORS 375) TaxID=566679 RepID=UPI000240A735|nr:hypothetical protein [Bradyrhizobium sp. ORS 375]CCD92866.1 conserved exported hypothetical protein [Bradyrhizobium sp. ORS 375]
MQSRSLGVPSALVFAALVALWPHPTTAGAGFFDLRTLCQPLEIHDGVPQESACLKELPATIRRDGRKLTLGLAGGKTKVITDAKECEPEGPEADCISYRLVGRLGDRHYIVLVTPYECSYVMLVNRRTGAETKLGSGPFLSPNGKRFVTIDPRDDGNCGIDYRIGMFSYGDIPKLEWSYKPEGIEPYEVDTWIGDNRVRLQASDEAGKEAPTDLTRTAQGWQLRRPNGEMSLGTVGQPAPAEAPRAPSSPAAPSSSR